MRNYAAAEDQKACGLLQLKLSGRSAAADRRQAVEHAGNPCSGKPSLHRDCVHLDAQDLETGRRAQALLLIDRQPQVTADAAEQRQINLRRCRRASCATEIVQIVEEVPTTVRLQYPMQGFRKVVEDNWRNPRAKRHTQIDVRFIVELEAGELAGVGRQPDVPERIGQVCLPEERTNWQARQVNE